MGTLCDHDYHVKQINSALDRVALLRGIYEMHKSVSSHLDPKTLILIWDTGGSAGLTPFRSDFIDYVECDIDVRDVTKVNKVIGIGKCRICFWFDCSSHETSSETTSELDLG